jgi:hypothetical protein
MEVPVWPDFDLQIVRFFDTLDCEFTPFHWTRKKKGEVALCKSLGVAFTIEWRNSERNEFDMCTLAADLLWDDHSINFSFTPRQ